MQIFFQNQFKTTPHLAQVAGAGGRAAGPVIVRGVAAGGGRCSCGGPAGGRPAPAPAPARRGLVPEGGQRVDVPHEDGRVVGHT